jgi:signal transduction histidine kinase
MNGIMGMNQLLLATELTEEQHEYASLTASSAELMLGIVNDVLDISKIEASNLELVKAACDPRLVVDLTADQLLRFVSDSS